MIPNKVDFDNMEVTQGRRTRKRFASNIHPHLLMNAELILSPSPLSPPSSPSSPLQPSQSVHYVLKNSGRKTCVMTFLFPSSDSKHKHKHNIAERHGALTSKHDRTDGHYKMR